MLVFKAKKVVADEYPEIVALQDVPHTANLLAKDIGEAPSIAYVVEGLKKIRAEIHLNQYTLAFYRDIMRSANNSLNKENGEQRAVLCRKCASDTLPL